MSTLGMFCGTVMATVLGLGPSEATCTSPEALAFQRDRQAILAMAGEFEVSFSFEETVSMQPGYSCTDVYETDARELVIVAEDRGNLISLQHILVIERGDDLPPKVIKHWRQDWRFEDTELTVYRGHHTWESITLPESQVEGRWSQAVYQVDDAPRYEALGAWTHIGDSSSWESDETWRPLPRREYTKRDDYHVVVARNRHTITPDGWVHEQTNAKLVLTDDGEPLRILAHETGLNRYKRDHEFDFSVASSYWREHEGFWREVRTAWKDVLNENGRVQIERKVNGERLSSVLRTLMTGKDERRADRESLKKGIQEFVANAGT